MPPRHAYWTIIVDDQPTAFRAHDAEELEPTLNRLKEKHPSAVMRRDSDAASGGGKAPDRTVRTHLLGTPHLRAAVTMKKKSPAIRSGDRAANIVTPARNTRTPRKRSGIASRRTSGSGATRSANRVFLTRIRNR